MLTVMVIRENMQSAKKAVGVKRHCKKKWITVLANVRRRVRILWCSAVLRTTFATARFGAKSLLKKI